ncbi:MAG: glycosyltransferase [Bacteroidia bacterium]
MILSVIIVNYNVKYFLEQALYSVRKASKNLAVEVFVVDNHSVDGSCDMVRDLFPEVNLIENKINAGFAKANNQAIKQAKGKYILLLNPDTVVEEDCFSKLIDFMEQTPDSGAVGVKMIDGSGRFLPESKRGLPTPEVAFYKIFGLAALFPKSKRFGKYHLGYLDNNKIHVVDVLAGAFMFIRKDLLLQVGMLDESYFMYGEDIDLSYCINKAGYKNYYFPHTTIIHYKGESTKRTSVNYVFTFYRAMILFAKKHYSQKHAALFSFLIHIAIYIRALIAIIHRIAKKIALPSLDFALFFACIFLIKNWYANYKFNTEEAYPETVVFINSIVYSFLWIFGLYISGAYNKRKTFLSVAKGIAFGTIAIAIFYAFVEDTYRFSRAVILLSSVAATIAAFADRVLFYFLKHKKLSLKLTSNLRTIIVGNKQEVERVQQLLIKSKAKCHYLGYVSSEPINPSDELNLGNINELDELIKIFNVEEIIFCSKDLPASDIIQWMSTINQDEILFKIAPEQSLFIIGSNNKKTPGDFYTLEINLKLNKPFEQNKKRVFDIALSIIILPLIPILLIFIKHPFNFIKNIFSVLNGDKTWVGYASANNIKLLPKLKKGIVTPANAEDIAPINETTIQKLNFLYAKDYSIEKDLLIVLKAIRYWGNN